MNGYLVLSFTCLVYLARKRLVDNSLKPDMKQDPLSRRLLSHSLPIDAYLPAPPPSSQLNSTLWQRRQTGMHSVSSLSSLLTQESHRKQRSRLKRCVILMSTVPVS